jgi:cytoskeleton protein RodZ
MPLFQRFRSRYAESLPEWDEFPQGPRSAGDLLRQRREALGLEVTEVAAALRIKPAYLMALEDGQPGLLPGPAYAIGFLRAYGEHLGLDGNEILRRFKQEATGLDTRPDLSFPMPLGESSIPGRAMLLVAAILAVCGYGTWYYLSTADRSRPERVTEVPRALSPPAAESSAFPDADAPPAVLPPAEGGTGTAAVGSATADVATESTAVPSPAVATPVRAAPVLAPGLTGTPVTINLPPNPVRPDAAAAPTTAAPPQQQTSPPAATPVANSPDAPAAAPAQREPPHSYGGDNAAARIVIIATAESWVQLKNPDGSMLFSHVMAPGDSYRVPDRPGITMRTGNAGGIEITVDGKAVPAIGRSGAIRRGLTLDPQALASGNAGQQ